MVEIRDELRQIFDPAPEVGLKEIMAASRRRRRRHRWMVGVGGSLAVVVAAVVAATVVPGATRPTQVTTGGDKMSSGVPHTSPFRGGGPTAGRSWRHGLLSLAPPLEGQAPTVSPEAVYRASQSGCTSVVKRSSTKPVIEYGDYTDLDYGTVQPNGTFKPFYLAKLVWLCMYLGVPDGDILLHRGGIAEAPSRTSVATTTPSERALGDVIVVVDSQTGRVLDERTEPSTYRDATFVPWTSAVPYQAPLQSH